MLSLTDHEFSYVSKFWDKHVNEINKCIKFVLYQPEVNPKRLLNKNILNLGNCLLYADYNICN